MSLDASERAIERAIISKMYTFINIMVMTRVKNRSPDMSLTAFDVKFRDTKNGVPPGACRPSKSVKKNNVDKVDPQQVDKQISNLY